MSNKTILLLGGLIIIFCILIWFRLRHVSSSVSGERSAAKLQDGEISRIILGNQSLQVEVVASPQRITQGLSGRPEIGSDGMLFILPRAQNPDFWMKEMQLALDLIWIQDWKVVEVTQNVPFPSPNTNDSDLPIYSPTAQVDMVLEVEAGKAQEWGIIPGARLEIK